VIFDNVQPFLSRANVYHWMNTIVHHPTWISIFHFCYANWVKITALLLMYFAIEKKDFCHHMLRLIQIGILITGAIFIGLLDCVTLFLGHHYFSNLIASMAMLILTLWLEKKLIASKPTVKSPRS